MSKYKRAKDYDSEEPRKPISARIKKSIRLELEKEAKAGGKSLGELIEHVLEDYIKWLKQK